MDLNLNQLYDMVIDFSEPMDTSLFSVDEHIEVTIDGSTNTSDKLTFKKQWSTDHSQLIISPRVAANKSGADAFLYVSPFLLLMLKINVVILLLRRITA